MSILSNFKEWILGKSNQNQKNENSTPEPKAKRQRVESNRITKHNQVRQHLLEHGSITSWEAIDHYGATRLSAIIYRLRNSGHDIESIQLNGLDRNRNISNFVRYVLHQH
jgi:hypothetical protein